MIKVFRRILGTLVILMVALFLLFHFGVSNWVDETGKVDAKVETNMDEISTNTEKDTDEVNTKVETDTDESAVIIDKVEETAITIVVKQDQYFIDEQKVTLTQVKEMIMDKSKMVKVYLEDNYASAKTWDKIKKSCKEWGITPIEQ